MTEQSSAPQTRAPTSSTAPKLGAVAAIAGALCAACLLPFTASREGERLTAYQDIAGVWTICDGDTVGVQRGMTQTPAQCAVRLDVRLAGHLRAVLAATPGLKPFPYRLAAAADIAYNIGDGAYAGSTVAKRFRAGDWRGGCDAMLAWNKARVRGQLVAVAGLTKRRQDERALCLRGLPAV
jgi:lysozyme